MANGYIRKRNKKYSPVIQLDRDPDTGKIKQKSLGSFKTKKEAEIVLNDALVKLNNNTFVIPEKLLLKDFLMTWLDTYAINLSPTTYVGYKQIICNHLIPELGNIELQKLHPIKIQQYYNSKSKNLKGKTLLQHHRVLRKALNYAWKMQLLSKNPADLVDAPKVKKFEATVLEPKDVKRLLNAVKNTRFEVPTNLALSLGLRLGEILGLRWSDVDFQNETITIEQTLVRAGTTLIFKDPKTEGSKRVISSPIELLNLLKDHKIKQMELQIRSGGEYINKHNLVCTKDNGDTLNTSSFSHAFGDFIKKLDIPHVRFHDLRHTNATLMLLSGTPAKVASSRLGHSTINITLDLYSHVLKDMNKDAAERLNEVIYK
ncbi:MAG: site-specific integrase [Clostridium sp.]|nr:site-specific integrase [Clostridium sp.]